MCTGGWWFETAKERLRTREVMMCTGVVVVIWGRRFETAEGIACWSLSHEGRP